MGLFKTKNKSTEVVVNSGIGARRAKNRELHRIWDAEYRRLCELMK